MDYGTAPPYDPERRAEAAALDGQAAGWSVFYGVWSRRFSAFCLWPVSEPVVLSAPTAGELAAMMRQAEEQLGFGHDRSGERPGAA